MGATGLCRLPARSVSVLVLASAALGACGAAEDTAVGEVARAFHEALQQGDGNAACELLAPATRQELVQSAGKKCEKAILEEKLPHPADEAGDIDVFDGAGEIRYGSETVFLDRFPDGWKVSAAGCTSRAPRPYDCKLSGG